MTVKDVKRLLERAAEEIKKAKYNPSGDAFEIKRDEGVVLGIKRMLAIVMQHADETSTEAFCRVDALLYSMARSQGFKDWEDMQTPKGYDTGKPLYDDPI